MAGEKAVRLQAPASLTSSEPDDRPVAWSYAALLRPIALCHDCRFSWGASFPDKILVFKKIDLFPFRFKLSATFDRHQESLGFNLTCKDQILGGR